MDQVMNALDSFNSILWDNTVLFIVLAAGVLFTIWSGFGQYRALTHGVAVIRGRYDRKDDPGAINHFQALSTALSATVGLGNIAGVAIAISLGGPGAVFWMWVTGLVGMALKMTEVTQSMLYRNTDDPENPHGGPMWVCKKGLSKIHPALAPIGVALGGLFCITLIISTVTGGNTFQAWNVADIGFTYFGIPKVVTGIVLTLGVGIVIVGGIKRIGDVAGKIVPFMCGIYILAGLYVIVVNAGEIPGIFKLIVIEAFKPSEAAGAFLGGAAGYGFLKGMQRALFSNEAGQGSAPIAHSAAKTDEPVREGIVAGLEPFVDTLCVCTITALVILLSGTWNRDPALEFVGGPPAIVEASPGVWQAQPAALKVHDAQEAANQLRPGAGVFLVVRAGRAATGGDHHQLTGTISGSDAEGWTATFDPLRTDVQPVIVRDGAYLAFKGATLTAKAYDRVLPGLGLWIVPATAFLFAFSTMISWSYYGEQGVVFLFGRRLIMPYRVIYCLLILISCTSLIRTENELDIVSTLGTGIMLWVNIPIMLIFGPQAMREYHRYIRRLKAGEFRGHGYPKITDVVEGRSSE